MAALLASLVLCGPRALGQTGAKCPLDGATLTLRAAPWNLAGGKDSDGCSYALDAQGRRRVVGLNRVVVCPSCRAAFRRDHLLKVRLTTEQKTELKKALRQAGRTIPGLPKQGAVTDSQRFELAALTYRTLGKLAGIKEDTEALVGELFLCGAWAARGAAVVSAPEVGYRPRTLSAARRQLQSLRRLVGQDPKQAKPIQELDKLLSELEEARARLSVWSRAKSTKDRLRVLRGLSKLASVERWLLKRKRTLLAQARGEGAGRLSGKELKLGLIAATLRYGSRDKWESLLDALQRAGTAPSEVRAIRAACRQEQRLLGLAEQSFLRAAGRAAGARKGWLLYLAGDIARRRGDGKRARKRLREARRLAPGSEVARRASFLLGG